MTSTFKVIAFDADDTLFINEPYFDEAEEKFCALMSDYLSKQSLAQALFKTQISNLPLYGYGIKGYVLSMVQTAYEVSNHTVSTKVMEKIIEIG
ncbi:MAG: HAD family hydrolase, partial [Myroides sp.]|nr:HAD family hydrolase [Myroides sp.]